MHRLCDLNFLRLQSGRMKSGVSSSSQQGFRFSPRAIQLWRFSLGSNAAVIKKISNGGTATARELAAQMGYLIFITPVASSCRGGRMASAPGCGLPVYRLAEVANRGGCVPDSMLTGFVILRFHLAVALLSHSAGPSVIAGEFFGEST